MRTLCFGLLSTLLLFVSCGNRQRNNEKTVFIAPYTLPCMAGAMATECLQVKWSQEQADWENLYDPIEGFAYEVGTYYELIVAADRIPNPPADGSSLRYRLVKIVSATSMDYLHNSRNTLDWEGTYESLTAKGQNDTLITKITLSGDNTFTLVQEYKGGEGAPLFESGIFVWSDDGRFITLHEAGDAPHYQVGENRLIPMQAKEKEGLLLKQGQLPPY